MELKITALVFALGIPVMVGTGCPTSPVTNNPTNERPAERVEPKPEQRPTETAKAGSLATPTDAYKAFHEYSRKKDIPQLKRVMSKEILEFFASMGNAQNRSLDEELIQLAERPKARIAEARNERITGNRALIEFKDENGEWKEMDFVKEDGEWKLTLPKASGS